MDFLNNFISALNPFSSALSITKMIIIAIVAIVVIALIYSYATRKERMSASARAIKIREFT